MVYSCRVLTCTSSNYSDSHLIDSALVLYHQAPDDSSAPASGFPLTDTAVARSFVVASAHDPAALDWPSLTRGGDTLVLLMCAGRLAFARTALG